jgi:hypothetical protein
VDFVACTRVQGEKPGRRMESDERGGERMLNVAEEGEFGQTASIETIEYWMEKMRLAGRDSCSI